MKKLMRYSFLTILMIFLMSGLFTYQICAQEDNLLRNPSFEDGDASWGYYDWRNSQGQYRSEFTYENGDAHSGAACGVISSKKPNDARFKQSVPVSENKIYRISCWIKTKDVGMDNKGANISIEGRFETSSDIKGTTEQWNHTELYVKIGQNVDNITATFGLGSYGSENTGTAYFDDAVVEEVDSIPEGAASVSIDKGIVQQRTVSESEKPLISFPVQMLVIAGVIAVVFLLVFLVE